MGRLIYSMNVSLDGYVAAPDGSLEWADVDEEVHTWFNDVARETAAFLYGRRLYETMAAYWPRAESDPGATPFMLDFARIWRRTPKIVFSASLAEVHWNSRLVRGDPVAELPRLRAEFAGDLSVGGPTLAAAFIQAGSIDEYRLVVHPVAIGAGLPFFSGIAAAPRLRLIATRAFGNGAVYLGYRPA
jgi:dihydrofolate reductase